MHMTNTCSCHYFSWSCHNSAKCSNRAVSNRQIISQCMYVACRWPNCLLRLGKGHDSHRGRRVCIWERGRQRGKERGKHCPRPWSLHNLWPAPILPLSKKLNSQRLYPLHAVVVKAVLKLAVHSIAFRDQWLLIKTTANAAVQKHVAVISMVLKMVPEFCDV